MNDVPMPPAGPVPSALPMVCGTVAPICSLGVMPTDASMTGKWTSVKSVPAHRMIENVNDVAPGARRLASSSHAIGEALATGPVVGLGRGLLLGGALLCAFPLLLLLPCACIGTATASAIAAPAIALA